MFGFSVTKILFTAAVIIAVWYGFKWAGRVQHMRSAALKNRRGGAPGSGADSGAGAGAGAAPETQDMLPCPRCGVYLAAGASHACDGPSAGPNGGDDNAARPG